MRDLHDVPQVSSPFTTEVCGGRLEEHRKFVVRLQRT